MKKMMRRCVIFMGLACIITAGFLYWDTQQDEQVALQVSAQVAQAFQQSVQSQEVEQVVEQALYVTVAEKEYMGLLSIPQLGLELPVASACTYADLAQTPCVYSGTIEQADLIIGAHNFQAHFGTLSEMNLGEALTFLDAAGMLHTYALIGQEIVDGNDLAGLQAGTWDLTLFTCLYGDNTQRVVLRFEAVGEPIAYDPV